MSEILTQERIFGMMLNRVNDSDELRSPIMVFSTLLMLPLKDSVCEAEKVPKCRVIVKPCLVILLLTELAFWPQIREAERKSASHRSKEEWAEFSLFDFCQTVFIISVICLMNCGKSKYNNPRIIYGWAPVNPLMTFLMKVTSLQNGGCSFVALQYRARTA